MQMIDLEDAVHIVDIVSADEGIRKKCKAIRKRLKGLPTSDVVEVVRCKDCEHWGCATFGNVCKRWSSPFQGLKNCTTADDFCSYSERKKVQRNAD